MTPFELLNMLASPLGGLAAGWLVAWHMTKRLDLKDQKVTQVMESQITYLQDQITLMQKRITELENRTYERMRCIYASGGSQEEWEGQPNVNH